MNAQTYLNFEIFSMIAIVGILLFDVLYIFKRPHIPSTKESTLWVSGYALLALVFAFILLQLHDATRATEFIAGWLTEYSLS